MIAFLLLIPLLSMIASVAMLVITNKRIDERIKPYLDTKKWILNLGSIIILIAWFLCLFKIGSLGRGETSPLPWEAFSRANSRNGLAEGFAQFFLTITFLLWAFLIPGHLKATSKKNATGSRPSYPYVINFLFGLLLVTPNSPLHRFLDLL